MCYRYNTLLFHVSSVLFRCTSPSSFIFSLYNSPLHFAILDSTSEPIPAYLSCLIPTRSFHLSPSPNQRSHALAGRTSRKANIVYRVMWQEMKRGFTNWASQVGEVLWLRDRLWQLRERSCRRVLRLCFLGTDVHHIQHD